MPATFRSTLDDAHLLGDGAAAADTDGPSGAVNASTDQGVDEGGTLGGRYRIGRVLGRGSMGIVVAAEHLLLKETVAIKFMTAERCQDPEFVNRFLQEARAARRLQSAHATRVLDVAVREDGVPYMVMEYLEGVDLAEKLARSGPFSACEVASWIIEACHAIDEAHRLGIVHRDVKPANLFHARCHDQPCSNESIIKILDFGISKNRPLATATVSAGGTGSRPQGTDAHALLGSPSYMSPEQIQSARDANSQSDIWSIGVTMFQLLTGQVPFEGATAFQIYRSIVSGEGKAWQQSLTRFPRELVAVLERCLTIESAGRYASAADLALALSPFATPDAADLARRIRRNSSAPPSSASGGAPDSDAWRSKTPGEGTTLDRQAPSRRRYVRWGLPACVALGLAFALLHRLGPRTPDAETRAQIDPSGSAASMVAPPLVAGPNSSSSPGASGGAAPDTPAATPAPQHGPAGAQDARADVALTASAGVPVRPQPAASVGVPVRPQPAASVRAPAPDASPAPSGSRLLPDGGEVDIFDPQD
jgi:serine/threonine-protein kinase